MNEASKICLPLTIFSVSAVGSRRVSQARGLALLCRLVAFRGERHIPIEEDRINAFIAPAPGEILGGRQAIGTVPLRVQFGGVLRIAELGLQTAIRRPDRHRRRCSRSGG